MSAPTNLTVNGIAVGNRLRRRPRHLPSPSPTCRLPKVTAAPPTPTSPSACPGVHHPGQRRLYHRQRHRHRRRRLHGHLRHPHVLPGSPPQTIAVKVTGDTTVEPTETFTVALSNPSGATLSRATATATITNDDAAVTPGLSISDASATEPGAGGIAPGYLHTSGNQIVDSQGKPVQLSSVNWFGTESTTFAHTDSGPAATKT